MIKSTKVAHTDRETDGRLVM